MNEELARRWALEDALAAMTKERDEARKMWERNDMQTRLANVRVAAMTKERDEANARIKRALQILGRAETRNTGLYMAQCIDEAIAALNADPKGEPDV